MNILILGGTGAMGTHLVQLLNKKEGNVFVTTRSERKCEDGVIYIQGNAKSLDFIKLVLSKRWDAIVDFMVYSTIEFQERAELFLKATNQYFFISSARVYSDKELPVKETTSRLLDVSKDKDFLETDEYSLAKARQENILTESKYKNWTIIRPYITYDKMRLQLGVLEKEEWLYRALHGRTIVFSNDISTRLTTMTYGLDVSRGIVELIGKQIALGEIFHITVGKSRTWNDILSVYLNCLRKVLGYKPKVMLSNLDDFFRCRPAKYQVVYDRLFNREFDNSKISQYIDTDTFIETSDGLQSCLESFLEKPYFTNINWVEMAKMDRLAGERTAFNEISGIRAKLRYLKYRYL